VRPSLLTCGAPGWRVYRHDVMKKLDKDKYSVSDCGLRHGLLIGRFAS
jgi:hypothetical protein